MVACAQTGIFQSRGGFFEERHFKKHFIFDKQKKHRVSKNVLHVLDLFLFLEEFQTQCFYKIVFVTKIFPWTNSFYVQTTGSKRCCTNTSRSTFFRGFV